MYYTAKWACDDVLKAQISAYGVVASTANMPGSEKNLAPDVPNVFLSAGIAYAHWKTPLAWLLEEARNAEHRAKNEYQRNALALSVIKRGGEILHWGAKFDSAAWKLYDKFIDLDQSEVISGKFASALAQYLSPYLPKVRNEEEKKAAQGKAAMLKPIIQSDFNLVCKRQKHPQKEIPQEFAELANAYITELTEDKLYTDFHLLFLCASFLTRKPEKKEEK